jgi:prepilin-type N-terminal cleavage/methylation domain-containing protein
MLINEKGFTLIEIITVIIILGILAAIAIPKYTDLQKVARDKALEGALAQGFSTLSMQYARISLSFTRAANATEIAGAANSNPPTGDFNYVFSPDTNFVTVSVRWLDNAMAGYSSSKTRVFKLP